MGCNTSRIHAKDKNGDGKEESPDTSKNPNNPKKIDLINKVSGESSTSIKAKNVPKPDKREESKSQPSEA